MDVVIAGLGLIGGSLGMALREEGWKVSYVDPAVSLEQAQAAGAADERLDRLVGDLIVLATPADVALRLLAGLAGSTSLVTSVSSAMAPLRDAGRDLNFVAGHPFAGSELRGLAGARADLFAGRPWFVEHHNAAVTAMIVSAGSEAVIVDAEEHDRLVALTSHLPQVVATALASLLEGVDPRFVGSGARSMLRLAGSSHAVWQPILEQNQTNISQAAEELWRVMGRIGGEEFERAQRFYKKQVAPTPVSSERPER